MFHLMFSLPALYVIARFIWSSPWRRGIKIATTVLVVLASQYHFYNRLTSGSVFSPEMPRELIILLNWGFCSVLLLALLQILVDAVMLVLMLLRWRRLEIARFIRTLIAIAAMVLSAFGVSQAIKVPDLKDVQIEVRNLPAEFDGYKVLQLTDMHISRLFPSSWTEAMVQRTAELGVDLIVVTGDVIDGTVDERRLDVAALGKLRAPDGVFLIPGNHEYYFGFHQWMAHLSSLGMQPLLNSHTVLRRGSASLYLAGVTDLTAYRNNLPVSDVGRALAGIPANSAIVLLDHQPRNARHAADLGAGLQLSGHTHGGLIAGLDPIFSRANDGYVSGRYEVGNMTLYVNNGTAIWPGVALRLGRPSELTRITLKRKIGHD